MLLAHSEAAWGLSLASFELGGSLGIDLDGRRSSVSGYIFYRPGLFCLYITTGSIRGPTQSLSYKARRLFLAG